MGIAGQLLEAVLIAGGLGRGAETNLIRGDDAIACTMQNADRLLPGGGAEVFAVQQHHRVTVGLIRLKIHIAHAERLFLRLKIKLFEFPGVVKTFQLFTVLCCRCRPAEEQGGQHTA